MKNLNILLATAMILATSTAIFAVDAIEVTRCNNAIALKKEAESKQTATDKNLRCKLSPNKKFFAIMMRNERGRGTSVTVYDLDTKTVIIKVNPKVVTKQKASKTVTKQTTIRDFDLTDTTLVVKERKHLKATTYNLVVKTEECKKCKKALGTVEAGTLIRARAFGFVPVSKK
ncbi:MAG: hypothetical protein UR12_C0043G0003 [candidate division TM6 bacterium GW2011_GWF2_30_66]|jgi:hypothetical protein|nr:MAG: hypothetical protein UR12_C0043G0003 [candidate division TM6 bacterium GW2011_GWF2_30_66]